MIFGVAYKANVPDTRNSKAIEVIKMVKQYYHNVDCIDPLVDGELVSHEHSIEIRKNVPDLNEYDMAIILVEHKIFAKITEEIIEKNIPLITINDLL